MTELFTTFSVLFWAALAALSILLVVATETDHRGKGSIFTIVFLIAFWPAISKLLVGVTIVKALLLFLTYITCGAVWTLCKWWLHCKSVSSMMKDHPPTEQSGAFNQYSKDWYREKLKPGVNKGRITFWGVYWPFSLIYSMTHDIAARLFDVLRSRYDAIARPMLAQLNGDGSVDAK